MLSGLDPAELHLQGVLDFIGADALDRITAGILNKSYRRILVDASKLEKLTSAGADSLLKSAGEARRRSARIALVSPPPAIRSFMESLGLDRQIDLYPSVEDAIRGVESEL